MLVRVEGVVKRYFSKTMGGAVEALKGVSLTVGEGEFVVLHGPNASGKSTLLRVLAGITLPDEGRVEVCGEDLAQCSPECLARLRRTCIGFVPQTLLIPPGLRVLETVGMPLWIGGDRGWRTKATEVLSELGLDIDPRKKNKELSIGVRQRIAIARALVSGPRLILADEPFSHLDEEARKTVLRAFKQRISQGASILVATPRPPGEAEGIAERFRLLHMHNGILVQDK